MWERCAAEGCTSDGRKRGKYGYMANVEFFPFPTQKRAPKQRKKWLELLRRQDYEPKKGHRVCSLHFVDGRPTKENPYPTLFAYNNFKTSRVQRSDSAVLKRSATQVSGHLTRRSEEAHDGGSRSPVMVTLVCCCFIFILT